MRVQIDGAEGLPEALVRGRILEGLIQNVQVLLVLAGAIALPASAASNRWIGAVLGGALLVLEVARWIVGRHTLRRLPSFSLEDYLASAPIDSAGRTVLALNLVATLVAAPVVLAYTDLDPGVVIFGCAVIAVCWFTVFRMWRRRSWLAFSWVPGPRARDHFR